MTKETDSLFEAFFTLEDIRQILRDTAPSHKLGDMQKEKLRDSIARCKKHLDTIGEELG